jgi:energy-coupling factor transporter ATP-binding protein EcfA2
MLTVSHLVMRFGGITALNDVSFSLAQGDITALIGPNGAGKTTLLSILAGRMFPTRGLIEVLGEGRRGATGGVLRRGVVYGFWLGLAFAAIFGFGAKALLWGLGLDEALVVGAAPVLVVFALSFPFYMTEAAASVYLEALSRPRVVTAAVLACSFLNLLLDLVLVPGLAFDRFGNRLGRGRGFYDRLLGEVSGVKCGICYQGQLLESLPTEGHDVSVNFIVTPNECLKARKKQ